jgi:hypothetical protein
MMLRKALLGFIALATLTGTVSGQEKGKDQNHAVTIDLVRRALETPHGHEPSIPGISLDLSGYNFHWEIGLGNDYRIILLSKHLSGAIFFFDQEGQLSTQQETSEIVSATTFDFDQDGLAEVILDQVDGRGTGLFEKRYHAYKFSSGRILHLWSGISYSRRMLPESLTKEPLLYEIVYGFIRADQPGGGRRSSRLMYWSETRRGEDPPELHRRILTYENGSLQLSPDLSD